jgi:hypothetical protein
LDARQNLFEFNPKLSFGKGKLTHIQYVYVSAHTQTVYGGAQVSRWLVTIVSAGTTHRLDCQLGEHECIWLANEIQAWLSSANI